MKKNGTSMRRFCLVLAAALSCAAFAQETDAAATSPGVKEIFTTFGGTVKPNSIILSGGAGFDMDAFGDIQYYIPVMGISAEYTLQLGPCPLGFGIMASYSGSKETAVGKDLGFESRLHSYNNTIVAAAIINWHFNLPVKRLDLYAGVRPGVRMNVLHTQYSHRDRRTARYITDTDTSLDETAFYIGGTVGATWYFTEHIGANLEVGWPVLAKASFSYKL